MCVLWAQHVPANWPPSAVSSASWYMLWCPATEWMHRLIWSVLVQHRSWSVKNRELWHRLQCHRICVILKHVLTRIHCNCKDSLSDLAAETSGDKIYITVFIFFLVVSSYFWLYTKYGRSHLTCARLPYNLYCVGRDVEHCTIQSNHFLFTGVDF